MDKLKGLKPEKVFKFFEYISSVPRGSGNTDKVSELCIQFAKERGLTAIKDKQNNVVIYKPATPGYENAPAVVLQGHLDMVCAKNSLCTKDMAVEPVELEQDGTYVYAKDTTLGGDDGIGVAYALAVLDSDDLEHPAIEAVFTIDEETGMLGAREIDPQLITGRRLINIDSEEEGVFTCGCAGGCIVNGTIPVERDGYVGNEDAFFRITLSGLKGGHSGADIANQPASANHLLGRVLFEMYTSFPYLLVKLEGGKFDNVISPKAEAIIVVPKDFIPRVISFIDKYADILKNEYHYSNPGIHLQLVAVPRDQIRDIPIDSNSTKKVLKTLYLSFQGVVEMNMELKGMVQTSQNLGTIELKNDVFELGFLIRSASEPQKETTVNRCETLIELAGGKTTRSGDYPGWNYLSDSPLRNQCVKVYEELYGNKPIVNTIHAGLECGLFVNKLEGLDAISMGPNIPGIHTPEEKLEIASVGRVWEFLKALLKSMK